MTQQQTLDGTPPGHGHLWRRVLDGDGHIDHPAWLRARAEQSFVGQCDCGGYLKPLAPEEHRDRTDYAAECQTCGREVCAPGGRVKTHAKRGG